MLYRTNIVLKFRAAGMFPIHCNKCVVPAHQTSDMSRCTISPESRLKLEMVILSNLRFLTILTFQYVTYQFMCPDFNKY